MPISNTDWASLAERFDQHLELSDRQLLDLLAAGKSTPVIAAILSIPRSTVWGRALKLKARLVASEASSRSAAE
jgi:DNA-binding CsgD family transcriptional regulator